jgi:acetyl/propionyl-CoA carboxylase alpha subunit
MCAAAIALGKAIGYDNAGTVEFLLDAATSSFFFLEVNTRLQVEHPVTECVTGFDIVREQIRIAQGEALGYGQHEVRFSGAAIECRLYAEVPERGFLPATGPVLDWHLPDGHDVRVDSGVGSGQEVSVYYDPMLAKVIAHAPTRGEAIDKLAAALESMSILGIETNRDFLARVLRHPSYRAGDISTGFLLEHAEDLGERERDPLWQNAAVVATTLVGIEERRRARPVLPSLPPAFRNNPSGSESVAYRVRGADETIVAGYSGEVSNLAVTICDTVHRARLLLWEPPQLNFQMDGLRLKARVVRLDDGTTTWIQTLEGSGKVLEVPRFVNHEDELADGGCVAPMPGKVIAVLVAVGDRVTAGAPIATLEAMKMEHTVRSGVDGVVERLMVAEGQQVAGGGLLAVIKADDATS